MTTTTTRSSSSSPTRRACRASFLAVAAAAAMMAALSPSSVSAFPGGAGGCSGEQGSVAGPHLSNQPLEELTTLAPLSVIYTEPPDFVIADLTSGASFDAGVAYTLTLAAMAGAAEDFKGFLFRLVNADDPSAGTSGLLLPADGDSEAQVAAVCSAAAVAGVTHTSSGEKETASAVMTVDEPGNYELQVTAVYSNNGGDGSEFSYETYDIVVVEPVAETDAPTAAPIETDAPTAALAVETDPPMVTDPLVETDPPMVTDPPVETDPPMVTDPPVETDPPMVTVPPEDRTLPPAGDEPPCSVCPPGETVGNPNGQYPGVDFTCGELESLIGANPQLVCPVIERLSSWFSLRGYCECQGDDGGGYFLPDVCTLCDGDETRVRDNVIVILPDNSNNDACTVLFDLVRFVEEEDRCPSPETEDACCRPAPADATPPQTTAAPSETDPPVEETDPPAETPPPVEETDPPTETTPSVEETPPPVEETPPPVEETEAPSAATMEVSIQDGAIKFEVAGDEVEITMTRDGEGWLAFGVSPDGLMTGATACIGIPGDSEDPQLYDITERALTGITPAADQILTSSSVVIDNDQTTLICKLPLDSAKGLLVSSTEENEFIWAYGDSVDELTYHGTNRGALDPITLSGGTDAPTNDYDEMTSAPGPASDYFSGASLLSWTLALKTMVLAALVAAI